jgi:hypothetical protein
MKVEADWRREKGIDQWADLSQNDDEAIRERMIATEWTPSPHDRLGKLLGSWGLLQYPLAAFLVFASLGAAGSPRLRGAVPAWVFYTPAMVGIIALGLAFYRGYFTSLGW